MDGVAFGHMDAGIVVPCSILFAVYNQAQTAVPFAVPAELAAEHGGKIIATKLVVSDDMQHAVALVAARAKKLVHHFRGHINPGQRCAVRGCGITVQLWHRFL